MKVLYQDMDKYGIIPKNDQISDSLYDISYFVEKLKLTDSASI